VPPAGSAAAAQVVAEMVAALAEAAVAVAAVGVGGEIEVAATAFAHPR
jgi:hypothetical protein